MKTVGIEKTPWGWFRVVNPSNPRIVYGYSFRLRRDAEQKARELRQNFAEQAQVAA